MAAGGEQQAVGQPEFEGKQPGMTSSDNTLLELCTAVPESVRCRYQQKRGIGADMKDSKN